MNKVTNTEMSPIEQALKRDREAYLQSKLRKYPVTPGDADADKQELDLYMKYAYRSHMEKGVIDLIKARFPYIEGLDVEIKEGEMVVRFSRGDLTADRVVTYLKDTLAALSNFKVKQQDTKIECKVVKQPFNEEPVFAVILSRFPVPENEWKCGSETVEQIFPGIKAAIEAALNR